MLKSIGLIAGFMIGALLLWEGYGLWRLYANVSAYAQFWKNYPTAGELTYVALGDSLAQGLGASRPTRGYVGVLAARLEKASGKKVRIINLSVTRARLADVLAIQIPHLRHYRPDLVTVDVGSNDLKNYDTATFAAQLETLAASLPPQTLIANLPDFERGQKGYDSRQASSLIAQVAQAHNLRLVKAAQLLATRASWLNYAPDFFHPNDRGYQIWADAFWAELQTLPIARPPQSD